MTTGIEKAIDAAGGRPALAEKFAITPQALHGFILKGWMPLERAQQASEWFGIPLRELVKPSIRDALDAQSHAA